MNRARVLVVDNHDSFVHTLVGYVEQLGALVDMVEADEISDAPRAIDGYDGVLVSPGPGTPANAGASIAIVRAAAAARVPLLGVCLGHQAIGEAFGATVSHAPELMHGMTSQVRHDGSDLYAGLPNPFTATRYHSLAIEPGSLPPDLAVTSRTEGGVIMGVAHRTRPVWGVQFHPESVLTEGGYRLLANWLATIGMPEAVRAAGSLHPLPGVHRGDGAALAYGSAQ
ncbi:MAG TPA: gamma-glutamyl-gamma-aminobutyrate hydrolase family protein [Microbacterium sp.]|nr:gamma-glutamyl-gamma-aminobutyrate hydrolase family protein [Microbacterium sp.]HWI32618.1 gamma-glutamyl-gamma-aminobutyrate hydrolase family protein [Microbacterium sp.]